MKTGRRIALIAAVAVLLLAGVGLSYAWFSQHAAMSTLLNILPPDSITIIPVDSEDGRLDLDFRDDVDQKDEETGAITIRRPVCIKSTSPVHQLEVVHTTNLKDLSFAIYPTTLDGDGNVVVPNFKDNPPTPVAGEYKNETAQNSGLAKQENLNNYKNGNKVEDHAYPLYWLAGNCGTSKYVLSGWDNNWTNVTSTPKEEFDSTKLEYKYFYYTYYILEIHWQEDNKETDLFYIMAQNIDVTPVENPLAEQKGA